MKDILIFEKKQIDNIYKIYKDINILFVKDKFYSHNNVIEEIVTHIKAENLKIEIYDLDEDIDKAISELLLKKKEFNVFIGAGLGGLLLFLCKINQSFVIDPVFDLDSYFRKNYKFNRDEQNDVIKLKSLVHSSLFNKKFNCYSFDKYYFNIDGNTVFFNDYKDNLLIFKEFQNKSKTKFKYQLYDYGIYDLYNESEKSLNHLIDKLVQFIKEKTIYKDEEKESKKINKSYLSRSDTWDKDWLPFICYDHQWDENFIYLLLIHKLDLMIKYFSNRTILLDEKSRLKKLATMKNARMLLKTLSSNFLDNVVEAEIGLKEAFVVYNKQFWIPVYCAHRYKNGYLDNNHSDFVKLSIIEKELKSYDKERYVVEKYDTKNNKLICIYDISSNKVKIAEIFYGNGKNIMWSTKSQKAIDIEIVNQVLKSYYDDSKYKIEYDNLIHMKEVAGLSYYNIFKKRKKDLIKLTFSYIAQNIESWWD